MGSRQNTDSIQTEAPPFGATILFCKNTLYLYGRCFSLKFSDPNLVTPSSYTHCNSPSLLRRTTNATSPISRIVCTAPLRPLIVFPFIISCENLTDLQRILLRYSSYKFLNKTQCLSVSLRILFFKIKKGQKSIVPSGNRFAIPVDLPLRCGHFPILSKIPGNDMTSYHFWGRIFFRGTTRTS